MKIVEYVKSLFNGVDKRDVVTEIKALEDELRSYTIPGFQAAVNAGLNASGNNYYLKQLQRLFNTVRADKRLPDDDIIKGVYRTLSQLTLTLPWLVQRVEKEYKSNDIPKEALDLRQATLLRYIDSIDFYLRYARSMLLTIGFIKTSGNPDTYKLELSQTVNEINFLVQTAPHFTYLMGIFTDPVNATAKLFDSIPNIIVEQAAQEVIDATLGMQADSLRTGFLPLSINIFCIIGKKRVERRVARLNKAKLEKQAVEMLISKLRDAQSANGDSSDPALDEQIEYNMGRIISLENTIKKLSQ